MKKVVAQSFSVKNSVYDDDYTLYEDGKVEHFYDRHSAPGGQNQTEILNASQLDVSVKERLLAAATAKNKDLVKKLLDMDD